MERPTHLSPFPEGFHNQRVEGCAVDAAKIPLSVQQECRGPSNLQGSTRFQVPFYVRQGRRDGRARRECSSVRNPSFGGNDRPWLEPERILRCVQSVVNRREPALFGRALRRTRGAVGEFVSRKRKMAVDDGEVRSVLDERRLKRALVKASAGGTFKVRELNQHDFAIRSAEASPVRGISLLVLQRGRRPRRPAPNRRRSKELATYQNSSGHQRAQDSNRSEQRW